MPAAGLPSHLCAARPDPGLLALDTATECVHLGLTNGQHPPWVQVEPGGAQASASLLPAIQRLLQAAGMSWGQIDALAFGRGPGAFTGLRTAASVAQGLALGAGKPVIGLDTLLAVAEDARRQGADARCIWVAQDARMGELYGGVYAYTPAGWRTLAEPALWTPGPWLSALQAALHGAPPAQTANGANGATGDVRPTACAGNAWLNPAGAQTPTLAAQLTPVREWLPVWDRAQPTGAALLELARQAWSAGQAADAAQALPLYVRDKVALTTAEREAARRDRPAAA